LHPTTNKKPVTLGTPPCTIEELTDSLDEFAEIYSRRPIEDNLGGMKAPQMFAAWFMVKKLQPKWIIESGVWYGQGTWFFEQASPSSSLLCIEPNLPRIKYQTQNAKYTTTDFSRIKWEQYVQPEETLCFFDDHQNAVSRVKVASPQRFKHLMFEDNYPVTQGDCVSLKTALEESKEDADVVKDYLESYYEFPPVVKGEKTRWGDDWTDELYPTHTPLLTEYTEEYKDYFDGYENYTWICYARIGEKN